MKIGDIVAVRGFVDEIRTDTVIIRNEGGYFGTVPSEIIDEGFTYCFNCQHYDGNDDWCDLMCMHFPYNGFCSKVKPKWKQNRK